MHTELTCGRISAGRARCAIWTRVRVVREVVLGVVGLGLLLVDRVARRVRARMLLLLLLLLLGGRLAVMLLMNNARRPRMLQVMRVVLLHRGYNH